MAFNLEPSFEMKSALLQWTLVLAVAAVASVIFAFIASRAQNRRVARSRPKNSLARSCAFGVLRLMSRVPSSK
ncbi:MAG TPA: hypothetical protein VFC78_05740 [Tepidisphaeraceae bacterium]|nr:hypothetical protein [Tepidisphaeraceae bacterium]